MRPHLKQYQVIGRESPSEANPSPVCYKYEIFAPNYVVAKSRFWKLMKSKCKVKHTHGDILSCKTVRDRKIAARNYSVDLVYYTQAHGFTHMTKEFRDVSKAGAVRQAFNEMGAQHRARYHNIDVMNVKSIANRECRRPTVRQFHNARLSFPLLHRNTKAARKDRSIFVKKHTKRSVVA